MSRARFWLLACLAVGPLTFVGCGEPQAEFSLNRLHLNKTIRNTGEVAPEQLQDIVTALSAIFGTPDNPHIVSDGEGPVVNTRFLAAAAGPVRSDRYGQGEGLYRQHCVHCHGITGNGRGPTAAFLNPYPRDFRAGRYKFTSTPVGVKPTEKDLTRTLINGIPGTAMPSFKLLTSGEIAALVDYVKYLTMRGEVERQLMTESGDFYAEDEQEYESLREEFYSSEYLVDEVYSLAVSGWRNASQMVTKVPERPEQYDQTSDQFNPDALQASVVRGRDLYYSQDANCFSCHGPAQLGDGQVTDYDYWTNEFFEPLKPGAPEAAELKEAYLQYGGLTPRNIRPRNLRSGVFRGGRRPIDIYWRIKNGIDGTPMPAANPVVTPDDIWDLVNYVLAVPHEPVSQPGVELRTNQKEVY